MKIFNVMMSRNFGGIEQCFLDYDKTLTDNGHEVINIVSFASEIQDRLEDFKVLPNITSWCFFSKRKLKQLVEEHKPDLIIAHGGRAVTFSVSTRDCGVPVIGVTHNYSYKRLKNCDYVIAITKDLEQHMIKNGYPSEKIYRVPNMARILFPYKARPIDTSKTIRIGSYGRFVEKKGFVHLIHAVKILKDKGYNIDLTLGGKGEIEHVLKMEAERLGISSIVKFPGWVNNRKTFIDTKEIFVCPSEHEPFGLVILEAMQYVAPIVTTRSEGPSEILEDGVDALFAENKSPEDIADKIIKLITDPEFAMQLTANAYDKLIKNYDMRIVGARLSEVLQEIKSHDH